MKYIIKIFVSGVAAFFTAYLMFPHVRIGYEPKPDFVTSLLLAVVLSFLNTFLKPLLVLLTIPLTVFTLGLFLLLVNAIIIYLASVIIPDFQVESLGWAILFSLILSVITSLLEGVLGTNKSQTPQGE